MSTRNGQPAHPTPSVMADRGTDFRLSTRRAIPSDRWALINGRVDAALMGAVAHLAEHGGALKVTMRLRPELASGALNVEIAAGSPGDNANENSIASELRAAASLLYGVTPTGEGRQEPVSDASLPATQRIVASIVASGLRPVPGRRREGSLLKVREVIDWKTVLHHLAACETPVEIRVWARSIDLETVDRLVAEAEAEWEHHEDSRRASASRPTLRRLGAAATPTLLGPATARTSADRVQARRLGELQRLLEQGPTDLGFTVSGSSATDSRQMANVLADAVFEPGSYRVDGVVAEDDHHMLLGVARNLCCSRDVGRILIPRMAEPSPRLMSDEAEKQHANAGRLTLGCVYDEFADRGTDRPAGPRWSQTPLNVMVRGDTGRGKSKLFEAMVRQAALADPPIPVVIVSGAKQETRNLIGLERDEDPCVRAYASTMRVYHLKDGVPLSATVNPFAPWPEASPEERAEHAFGCVASGVDLEGSLEAHVLEACTDLAYARPIFRNGLGPTLFDLPDAVERVQCSKGYSQGTRGDLSGAIVSRLRTLLSGSRGAVFRALESRPTIPDVLSGLTVVDISGVPREAACLFLSDFLKRLDHHLATNAGTT